MMNKEKIKTIIKNLVTTKNNKKKINIFFCDSTIKLNQVIKKKTILIFYGDYMVTRFIKVFFYLLYSKIKFQKNCFFLFNLERTLFIGHNFFPDWPGAYLKNNFFNNACVWIKKFIYILIFKKRLKLIFIETL